MKFRIKLRPAVNAVYIDKVWMLFTSGGFHKRPATSDEARELEELYAGEMDLLDRPTVNIKHQLQPA